MSISERAGRLPGRPAGRSSGRLIDARFGRRLILVNALIPAVLLGWDAAHHQLGVNEVNFAIHTTGMVGLVLIVLALCITPLRRLTGWNVLLAMRRTLGVLGFCYLVLHVAIFFVFDREASVVSTLHEMVARIYLWFGSAALVMLIPLAATSTDGMVRRLGARRWKRLHRLVYPIAIPMASAAKVRAAMVKLSPISASVGNSPRTFHNLTTIRYPISHANTPAVKVGTLTSALVCWK